MQDRAAWLKQASQGWIIYFMAGHSALDFENPAYAQILCNAVTFRVEGK
jgi:type 1 glutamine amidotransferase